MLLNFDERTYCTPVMCGQLRVGRSREIRTNKDLGEFQKKFTNLNVFFVLPVYDLSGVFKACLESFST